MGSSASKAARKYPEAVSKAVKSGVQGSVPPAVNAARLAENYRSEAIEEDAADPHFLAKLNKLGPVRVDHHMQTIRPPEATNTKQLFESRKLEAAELQQKQQKTRTSDDRLYGLSINQLLDRQKSVTTSQELVKLAEEFKMDVDKLRNLARFVNSPSVDKGSIRPAPGSKPGEDLWIANAVWVEPGIKKLERSV